MSDTDETAATQKEAAATPAAPPKKPATAKKPAAPKAEAKPEPEEAANTAADSAALGSMLQIAAPSAKVVEEETISTSLPSTMEFVESMPDTATGSAFVLSVYDAACFECGSLVPSAAEPGDKGSEPKCHFRFGNPFCPAANHRIQIVGQRVRVLYSIRKAQKKRDGNLLLKRMAELEELSLEDKNYVMQELGLLLPEEPANPEV